MNELDVLRLKRMKRISSSQGWTLILYNLLMTVAVVIVAYVITFLTIFNMPTDGVYDEEALLQSAFNSGWGYFLTIGVGLMILLLWKKSRYFANTICKNGAPMRFGSFMMIFVIFIGVQGVFQLLTISIELFLNSLGLSILEGIESATGNTDSLSMFLYVAIGAPISEELLFRGLVLRSFEPMGKKFAIFVSALLFGLFHGNIMQIPFAFLVGLVLAYVTLEHSIWWAMLLHMFNNLILSDTISRVLPEMAANFVIVALIYGCMIAGSIILIVKRREIDSYLKAHSNDPFAYRAFFSSAGMITFLAYILINIIFTTLVLITPYTFVA